MSSTTLFQSDDFEPQLVDLEGAQVAVLSRRGPGKVVNEDSAAVLSCESGHVLVVADGMGGHSAGEQASRIAIESIERCMLESVTGERAGFAVLDGIEEANRSILDLGVGAGTTLVAIHVQDGSARSFHVGDAVALHVGQRGRIKRRTLDHSPTAYAVEAGLLDEAEALRHGERHLVTNYVGSGDMRVEVGQPLAVARRDTILLASDGVLDNLHSAEVIERIRCGSLVEASRRVAELAIRRMVEPEPGAPSKPDDLTLVLYRRTA